MTVLATKPPPARARPPVVFRGAAARLFTCTDLEVLIEGPAGTGKSIGDLTDMVCVAERFPGSRQLIIRKTRKSLTESAMVSLEKAVLGTNHHTVVGRLRSHRQSYDFPNGSTIVPAGMDNPEVLFSSEWDRIRMIEATEFTEDEYELLLRGLRNGKTPYHQIVAECNPSFEAHWLNRRADRKKADGRPVMTRFRSNHRDNPHLWQKGDWTEFGRVYVNEILGGMTGSRRMRLLEGKWATAEGVVYPGWLPSTHLIPYFKIPKDWRRIRAIDFGFTNAFVCLWIAFDPDGRAYVYRQLYRTGMLVSDAAREILRLSGEENIECTISDHDAEDRHTLHRDGVWTVLAKKDITVGIQAVETRLRTAKDGKPRLFVLDGSLTDEDSSLAEQGKPTKLEQEFDSYVWAVAPSTGIKEKPVDTNNHALDALRYGIMYADEPSFVFAIA